MGRGTKRRRDNTMEDSVEPEGKKTKQEILVCDLCKLALPNQASMTQHLRGQKHRRLDNVEEERKRIEQKCGLYIRGFPQGLSQDVLLNYFSKYGKIIWVHFGHAYILLDYAESSAAETVINKTHYIEGRHLTVRYRQLRNEVPFKKPEPAVSSTDDINKLKDIPKFDHQVEVLLQDLQPHIGILFPKYNGICSELRSILYYNFPYCQVHPFGSTITGLSFNNSDIDVYISGVKRDENDVPYLYRIKHLLLSSRRFSNIIVIPQAKIPILKCVHLETGINCDINLKNMLGVCNSQLIRYYLNIHPKVRVLMMLLKYWTRVHKITGQNHLFSNYSLNMMLIFFLQQKPYRFHSVFSLQQNPWACNKQDGWNGGFEQMYTKTTCFEDITLLKLLQDFFTFYIEFKYSIHVICPYLGSPLKKDDFKTLETVGKSFHLYKQNIMNGGSPLKVDTVICLQDPFEHSRNTTLMVTAATLDAFVNFCRLGKKLCDDEENNLLYKLLTEIPPHLKSTSIVNSEMSMFIIRMKNSLKYIEKIDNIADRPKAWFENVTKFTTIVLKDFLKLDMVEINNTTSKNKKTEGQSDVYEEDNLNKLCFKCVGKLNLWQARKSTAKTKKPENNTNGGSILEKELAITKQLLELYKNFSQVDDIIHFELTLEHHLDPPEVVINIKKISAYKNTFKSFAVFLSANLPAWFDIYEKEQNDVTKD